MATKSQKTYLTEFIVLNLFNLARCEENYVSQFEHISKLLTTYLIYLSKTNTIFLKLWWRPQNCTKSNWTVWPAFKIKSRQKKAMN